MLVVVTDYPRCGSLWPEVDVLGPSRYVAPPAVRTIEMLVEVAGAADVTTAISLALDGNTLTLFDLVYLDV